MRRSLLSAGALGLGALVAAARQPTTTTTRAPAAVEERTQVQGTVPTDLAGRWVAVSEVRLPGGDVRSFARLFEIDERGGTLEVRALRRHLPPAIQQRADAAGSGKPAWVPTPDELRAIDAAWDTLTPIQQDMTSAEVTVSGADAYPPEFHKDEVTRGSQFAIALKEQFSGAQRVIGNYTVYAVRSQEPGLLRGDFITATMAAAPLPIPITLKGTFTAYRVGGGAGGRSWWQWIADLFSGCGRR